jgi:hypothetical protein
VDELGADARRDRIVVRHGIKRGETCAFGDRGAQVRIGVEERAELGDADDEGQQRRQQQRELDDGDAALAAAELREELHCTLTALEVLIAIVWM